MQGTLRARRATHTIGYVSEPRPQGNAAIRSLSHFLKFFENCTEETVKKNTEERNTVGKECSRGHLELTEVAVIIDDEATAELSEASRTRQSEPE
jgi:hypothetical protein